MFEKKLKKISMIIMLTCFMAGCEEKQAADQVKQESQRQIQPVQGIIAAVGDSLTDGLGVDESQAYPAILEKKLANDGYLYKVVNAGISGETSSGTLSRIKWVISSIKPDVVILVTGANDGMRGIDPALLRKNLDQIISILKKNNVQIILGGMKMLPNLGPDYAGRFELVYPDIADKHNIALIPFFLKGVAGEDQLNQPDGIHPTAEGYRVIVDHIYPAIVDVINNSDR